MNGLEIGVLMQKVSKYGTQDWLVDIGVRVLTVENEVAAYDMAAMQAMNFKNIIPVVWLTYWKTLYKPVLKKSYNDSGAIIDVDHVDHIIKNVKEFSKNISSSSTVDVLSEYKNLIREVKFPDWANSEDVSHILLRNVALLSLEGNLSDDNIEEIVSKYHDKTQTFPMLNYFKYKSRVKGDRLNLP